MHANRKKSCPYQHFKKNPNHPTHPDGQSLNTEPQIMKTQRKTNIVLRILSGNISTTAYLLVYVTATQTTCINVLLVISSTSWIPVSL